MRAVEESTITGLRVDSHHYATAGHLRYTLERRASVDAAPVGRGQSVQREAPPNLLLLSIVYRPKRRAEVRQVECHGDRRPRRICHRRSLTQPHLAQSCLPVKVDPGVFSHVETGQLDRVESQIRAPRRSPRAHQLVLQAMILEGFVRGEILLRLRNHKQSVRDGPGKQVVIECDSIHAWSNMASLNRNGSRGAIIEFHNICGALEPPRGT